MRKLSLVARTRDMASDSTGIAAAHERTRAAIVDAAIRVLADEGSAAKLDTVAVEAGVSRATLYRHFSSRDELLGALVDAAYQEVVQRVRAAGVDDVPFQEALARVARAAALTGKHFVVLDSELLVARPHHLDAVFEETMDGLFERGKSEGSVRVELSTGWLREVFRSLVVAAIHFAALEGLGPEATAALVVDQFLVGARVLDDA
jgi:AcrR family transcriptional regulator